jgi:CheY-like chemotaxis protein
MFTNVLLVDDDNITNFLNESLLQELEIANAVIVFTDGFSALEYINKNWAGASGQNKNLILLDINMPLMNGFEFLERLKDIELEDVYVVLLTTSSNEKDVSMGEAFNVDDYLTKPLTDNKILRLVEKFKEKEEI